MVRLISALILVLVVAAPTLGQQSLVGTYKLVSFSVEADGKPYEPLGKAPYGYLVITPTRFMYFLAAENRKIGTSVNEKAALLDTMVAYAGSYRIEGDKYIQNMEVSFTESEKGKTRVTTYELSGNRLTLKTGPIPFPRDLSKMMMSRQVWEKIE